MSLFWNRKYNIKTEKQLEDKCAVEVAKINHETHKTADKANKAIKQVNSLLKANGITLQIYTITGGRHGR